MTADRRELWCHLQSVCMTSGWGWGVTKWDTNEHKNRNDGSGCFKLKKQSYLCPSTVHRDTPHSSGLNLASWGMKSATYSHKRISVWRQHRDTQTNNTLVQVCVCVWGGLTCPASCWYALSYILSISWVNSAKFGMMNFPLKAFVSSMMLLPKHLREAESRMELNNRRADVMLIK